MCRKMAKLKIIFTHSSLSNPPFFSFISQTKKEKGVEAPCEVPSLRDPLRRLHRFISTFSCYNPIPWTITSLPIDPLILSVLASLDRTCHSLNCLISKMRKPRPVFQIKFIYDLTCIISMFQWTNIYSGMPTLLSADDMNYMVRLCIKTKII